MSEIWCTSDLHLNHFPVAWERRYGEWPTDEERRTIDDDFRFQVQANHNLTLAEKWDERVRPDDIVYVLGDLTANASHLDFALDWIQERPGRKRIIFGNHDPAHPMHRDAWKWERRYDRAFESRGTSAERYAVTPDGVKVRVLLSHFPYGGDHTGKEDRCEQHRLRDLGAPVIHGHVHSAETVTHAPHLQTFHGPLHGTPQIHVGVDAWSMAPVSWAAITQLVWEGLQNLETAYSANTE